MSINTLQATAGVVFRNIDTLKEALTHRSYLNENPKWHLSHNERLEFLGDAVLELATTSYLYRNFPKLEEGELTLIRSSLVNTKMIARVAADIGIRDELLISRGEMNSNDRAMEAILADAFEAFIGAVYLDQGYDAADKFIRTFLIPRIEEAKEMGFKDAKSALQEFAQAEYKITPTYNLIKAWGPEHEKTFKIGVYFGSELKGEGEGLSKQEAEQDAAKKLLDDFQGKK